MAETITHLRSHWLMLSSVLPDAQGHGDQQRAWRMLQQASEHHDVSLACRVAGAIHVDQWQQLGRLACRLAIEPASRWDSLSPWLGIGRRWSVAQRLLGRDIEKTLNRWDACRRIETVLVTEANLLDAAAFLKDRHPIVDGLTIASFEPMPIRFSPMRWPGRLAA